ncbi:MAG: M28 family peptidase [Ferruginibacter sp.]
MMKYILIICLFIGQCATAQKVSKADKKIIGSLRTHINYLADDRLEGRRTGSAGEKLAYEYITAEFKKAGIPACSPEGYLQPFEVNDGKKINEETYFSVNGKALDLNKDYFPLAISGNGLVQCEIYQSLKETGEIWFYDLNELLNQNINNPHFDLQDAITRQIADVAKKGATGLVMYNSSSIVDNIKFDEKDRSPISAIPVIYLSKEAKANFLADEISMQALKLNIKIEERNRVGHNVIAFLNNNAPTTVVIGAHYDHLGYGEDHNSLYAGDIPMIHNGADDNASGTAALIELGKLLTSSGIKKNNYLLIAFSGEELGLYGSKYFTEHPAVSLSGINYMINMDMVGRLNDSTHGLSIGGFGTSPLWGQRLNANNKYFKIKFDSSGSGPSDHTSFYRKDIPVLFFFTGTHSDYHKPTDDADKINYNGEVKILRFVFELIKETNNDGKIPFTKTRETASMGKNSFKVSLGIMPDYTFAGNGVHVDGVSAGRPAEKAGIKTGDVLIQLGDHKFSDVQSYMDALNKFNKGDATKVKVLRGKEELVFDIVF